jgi:hypothetical protein
MILIGEIEEVCKLIEEYFKNYPEMEWMAFGRSKLEEGG